ncbi:DUF4232 domain-containing protein [Dactylosporangium sp. CS-033363]|uniref:DUF4232 domain-containing protein n=1 Tax=Dactylosporangium sp. CS-033363 TaxID=3239935 RepID=UPI003D92D2CA
MTDPDDQFDDWLDRHRVEPLPAAPGAYDRIARTARRRRTVRVTAVAAAVTVLLAGVTGVAYRIATVPAPTPEPASSASPAPSATSSPPAPVRQSPSPPATTTSAALPTRCHTGDLKLSTGGAGGAAGSLYVYLVFTNVSGRTCTLLGYPGVSWTTGPTGQQINDPYARRTDTPPDRVVLAPHATAHALLQHGQPDLYNNCNPVDAAGLRVYPPDETTPVFVPLPDRVCSTKGIGVGGVHPIEPGPAE